MRRGSLLLLLLALAPVARAETPVEVFGGYAYARSDERSLHGWTAALALPLSPRLFVAVDAGGQYGSDEELDLSRTTFTAGPAFKLTRGRAAVFAHLLAGIARESEGLTVLGVSIRETRTGFAGLAGGGVDVPLAGAWALRLQGDYLWSRRDGESQGGLRLAAGAVLRLGGK
jgi:hypothetical protein